MGLAGDRPTLRALVVASGADDARFARTVLEDHGDEAIAADSIPDALARLSSERFDFVVVSLALPRGDGLALVHHMRALYPEVDVVVLAGAREMQDAEHAMALGVLTAVVLPMTGDALLVAADRVRERKLLIIERARLAAQADESRRRSATYARCAAFISETEAHDVAARVLDACAGEVSAIAAAIYVREPAGATRLLRIAMSGQSERLPGELALADVGMVDPSAPVITNGERIRVVMLDEADVAAVVELVCAASSTTDASPREGLAIVSALGSAALIAARKVEAIARGGIKDPETSAYTFAYFGDVAGREIERAARHGRRFALLTVTVEGIQPGLLDLRRSLIDAVLGAVRDSDVLARVEEDELYLLLPETGLLGALAVRRRIRERIGALGEGLDSVLGVATYPTDGSDLGRLLRMSRRRGERSRRGVWRRLGLARTPFWQAIDSLLGTEDDTGLGRDGTIALHVDLRRAHDEDGLARHAAIPAVLAPALASAIATDAVRYGVSGTIYAAGDSMTTGAVVRATESPEQAKVRAWVLGAVPLGDDPASRIRIPIDDPRIERKTLIISLTELGPYVLVARPLAPGMLLAYHAADLDLVEGLMWSLQSTYHLQPEVR